MLSHIKPSLFKLTASFAIVFAAMNSNSARAGVTYHVSATSGNDTHDGTSPARAWKSLDKANAVELAPGDSLLLEAGSVFKGQLKPKATGILADGNVKRVRVASYGSGSSRPRIDGEGKVNAAVFLHNVQGFSVQDLELTNTGPTRESGRYGLHVLNDSIPVARKIHVKNLFIHDVNGAYKKNNDSVGGIHILARQGADKSNATRRFDDVFVEDCRIKDCSRNGIIVIGGSGSRENWAPGTRVVVRNNLIEGVGGDGIVPWGCDGALIEGNIMRDCPAYGEEGGAAAGIWPFSSDNTVLQFNEVNGHKAWNDGQAFDCDYNCHNTLYQYNYSQNNEGGFMLICSPGFHPSRSESSIDNDWNKGSIIRYNLSINDGSRRDGHMKYKSPTFYITGETTQDTQIYRNLVIVPKKPDPQMDNRLVVFDKWGRAYPVNTHLKENIFVVEPGQRGTFDFGLAKKVLWTDNFFYGDVDPINDTPELTNRNSVTQATVPSEVVMRGTESELDAFKRFLKSKGNPHEKRGVIIKWENLAR